MARRASPVQVLSALCGIPTYGNNGTNDSRIKREHVFKLCLTWSTDCLDFVSANKFSLQNIFRLSDKIASRLFLTCACPWDTPQTHAKTADVTVAPSQWLNLSINSVVRSVAQDSRIAVAQKRCEICKNSVGMVLWSGQEKEIEVSRS